MSTFRKVEVVDARQFKGGLNSGSNLVLWVSSNQGKAEWFAGFENVVECMRIYHHRESRIFDMVFSGDWIERRQNGSFQVTRQQVIDTYEEV